MTPFGGDPTQSFDPDAAAQPAAPEEEPGDEIYLRPGWYELTDAKCYPEGPGGPVLENLGRGTITVFRNGDKSIDNFREATRMENFPGLQGWKRVVKYDEATGELVLMNIANPRAVMTAKARWTGEPPF